VKQVVYLGREMLGFPPGGKTGTTMVRGIPRQVDDKSDISREIMTGLYPEYKVINDDTYYIGSNTTLESISVFDDEILPGDKILIMRDMGLGDILLSLPTVKQLKHRYPHATITYATLPKFIDMVSGHDFIDEPVSIHDINLDGTEYKLIINFMRCLEFYSILRNRGRRVESFAKMIGIDLPEYENVVEPRLTAENYAAASDLLRNVTGPIITYVLQAVAWNRSYEPWKSRDVIIELRKALPDHTVVVLDVDAALFGDIPGVLDLGTRTETAMDAAAVCWMSDLVISPDTGMAHVSAALGIPTLVLLSSMPFEWRFDHYGDHVDYIHKIGAAPCVPCWDWQRLRGRIRYCNRTKDNVCMSSIKPAEIATKAARMIKNA